MRRLLALVVLAVVLVSTAVAYVMTRTPVVPAHEVLVQKTSTDFAPNKSLLATVAGAKSYRLFEGLPHQGFEGKLLADELRTKPTVRLGEFPFYQTPPTVSSPDWERLRDWFSAEGSFRQWIGEKKCGGFHPDYSVIATCDDSEYTVLICFGCSEILILGPKSSLRCDMAGETKKPIETMLKAYQVNRPKRSDD